MRVGLFIQVLLLMICAGSAPASDATNASTHLLVSFPSGDKMLLGYLYRPTGRGPFRGIIFHHGKFNSLMKSDAAEWLPVAQLFTTSGYMLFVPDRHPEAVDHSEYSPELQRKLGGKKATGPVENERAIEKQDILHRDVLAALQWFRQQPEVDTNRIIVAGQFGGAVQTLYDAENLAGVRALVAFSPANKSWNRDAVIPGLLTASVRKCKLPILLIFSENHNLAPAETLGRELDQKGKPNRVKIYPAPPNATAASDFAMSQTSTWGADVLAFLAEVVP